MPDDIDDKFYARADAHIHLSNEQAQSTGRGKVSASMMYGTARFNTWLSACDFESAADMAKSKEETIDYFVEQYRLALEDHFEDYIQHFDEYMGKTHE